ncbi:MAG: hypothetical protein BGO12_20675 [Verrucomicrobia bacterium 61-8]|mgnify:CR=1 FL=1|nr:hypothetical protein [Verrucomicrobiota bacterium]OJV25084.1 MAG: hypothetical protein BGO12_20675 [Verrucomicrobia bacterium 61-8]
MKPLLPLILAILSFPTLIRAAEDWSVEIVPTQVKADGTKHITGDFFVITTNRTNRNLRVWQQWNSWGTYTISFSVKPADGPSFNLEPSHTRLWTWNMPSFTIVEPGKSFVLTASISKDRNSRLEGFPEKFSEGPATVQAHFTIKEDEDTKRLGVWTGSASSAPETISIRKPD